MYTTSVPLDGSAGAAIDVTSRQWLGRNIRKMSRFCHICPPVIDAGKTRLTFEPVVPPTLLPSARLGSNRYGPIGRVVVGSVSDTRT